MRRRILRVLGFTGKKRKYPLAYCVELDDLISSDEAWKEMFNKQRKRHKLTFRCPNVCCRVLLVGVNMNRINSSSEASFKKPVGKRHKPGCFYAQKVDRRYKCNRDKLVDCMRASGAI